MAHVPGAVLPAKDPLESKTENSFCPIELKASGESHKANKCTLRYEIANYNKYKEGWEKGVTWQNSNGT